MSYVLKALSNFIHESVLKTDRPTDRPTDQVSPRSDFPSLKNTAGTPIGKLKLASTAPGVCTTIKNFKVDSKELSHDGNTNVYEFQEEGSNNNIMEDEVVNDPNLVVSTLDLAATLM